MNFKTWSQLILELCSNILKFWFQFVVSSIPTPTALFWMTAYFLHCGNWTGWIYVTFRKRMVAVYVARSTLDCYGDIGVNRLDWTGLARAQTWTQAKTSATSWIVELKGATVIQNQFRISPVFDKPNREKYHYLSFKDFQKAQSRGRGVNIGAFR